VMIVSKQDMDSGKITTINVDELLKAAEYYSKKEEMNLAMDIFEVDGKYTFNGESMIVKKGSSCQQIAPALKNFLLNGLRKQKLESI
jgi:hypothetical protein